MAAKLLQTVFVFFYVFFFVFANRDFYVKLKRQVVRLTWPIVWARNTINGGKVAPNSAQICNIASATGKLLPANYKSEYYYLKTSTLGLSSLSRNFWRQRISDRKNKIHGIQTCLGDSAKARFEAILAEILSRVTNSNTNTWYPDLPRCFGWGWQIQIQCQICRNKNSSINTNTKAWHRQDSVKAIFGGLGKVETLSHKYKVKYVQIQIQRHRIKTCSLVTLWKQYLVGGQEGEDIKAVYGWLAKT